MILKTHDFRRAALLCAALLLAGLGGLSACGQKGNLCMPQPTDGSKLPGNVPVCKTP